MLPVLPVVFLSGGVQASAAPPKQAGTRQGRRVQPAAGTGTDRPPAVPDRGRAWRISFSVFTLLGTLVLSALPLPDDIIRWAGLVVLVVLGVAMMFPRVQDLLERPFSRIRQRQVSGEHGGFVLGLALGAVYVPCAGPVLAAITVAGATGKIGVRTVALTVAFAIGTAIPLLVFALAGRGVAERVRAFRDRQRGVRIVAGAGRHRAGRGPHLQRDRRPAAHGSRLHRQPEQRRSTRPARPRRSARSRARRWPHCAQEPVDRRCRTAARRRRSRASSSGSTPRTTRR